MQQVTKVKRCLSEEYDIISWLFRILLGGAILTILIAILFFISQANMPITINNTIYWGSWKLPQAVAVIGFLIFVLISPLLISLGLSKTYPKLRIVPPYFIAIVGAVFSIAIWGISNFNNLFLSLLGGSCLIVIGYFEDIPAIAILGVGTDRANIYFQHFSIFANIDDVKARFTIPEVREAFFLSDKISGDGEKGYRLKTRNDFLVSQIISLT